MGIVNVTPDSFSDGGQFLDPAKAIQHGLRLLDEGAEILDIGGESTRPGASPITPADEQARILPVIEGLAGEAQKRGARLSVDTRNAATMRSAIKAGASIINDISALTHDPASLKAAAASKAHIVLMHMQGSPQTMQTAPSYRNVVREVFEFLEARIKACLEAGIAKKKMIADPGIGFGKTPQHNLELLKNLSAFHALGVPLLVGASRKSFISALYGPSTPEERLGGSLASALTAAQQGAAWLRVHDVKETRQFLRLWQDLQGH
jgi:dihydropteroate synthase